MNKTLSIIISIIAITVLSFTEAFAAGFGIYGNFSGGSADWAPDNELTYKKDTHHIGGGLVFDTAPDTDRIFNYQLNIGYDRFENRNSNAWGNATFDGLAVTNTFAFGTMINPKMRFWVGPEIRVEWADGKPDNYPDYRIRMFGFGLGPALGFNVAVGDRQMLMFKAGYQYISYGADGEGFYNHSTNLSTTSEDYTYQITEKMVYVTVGFLFKTSGDR